MVAARQPSLFCLCELPQSSVCLAPLLLLLLSNAGPQSGGSWIDHWQTGLESEKETDHGSTCGTLQCHGDCAGGYHRRSSRPGQFPQRLALELPGLSQNTTSPG